MTAFLPVQVSPETPGAVEGTETAEKAPRDVQGERCTCLIEEDTPEQNGCWDMRDCPVHDVEEFCDLPNCGQYHDLSRACP